MKFLVFCLPVIFCIAPLKAMAESSAPVNMTVSLLPLKSMIQFIAGESGSLSVMVKPGHSPETYEPTPHEMNRLQKTKIFFAAGVPFEKSWLPKLQKLVPNLQVVPLGVQNPDLDPHWWTSPLEMARAGRIVAEVLSSRDPKNASVFEGRAATWSQQMQQLHDKLSQLFSGMGPSNSFVVYHPAWSHFAKAYGLNQVAIESHGKEPGPKDLVSTIEWAKKKKVDTIFIQKQFSKKSASAVADALGAKLVDLDPLAENFAENLWQAGMAIKKGLR
ncbi:MAG: zinc ABC transporter substrate-binding protein [Pseudobdellovibrionaceae bacterium]|nr:MAG: zinc ABC transporter substrate-binding protein [Pseudobdellovibrionaceae bacterium]